MKLKNLVKSLSAVALAATMSTASAALVILDGWQLVAPPSGPVTNIGRLNLTNGTSTVIQEVDALGNVYANGKFMESGAIFSIGYTPEDTVGGGDGDPTQFPIDLPTGLRLGFTNVSGHVTSVDGAGGFNYVFDSGDFTFSGETGINYASGSIIGTGGHALSTNVIGGVNGDSTLLGQVLRILDEQFDLRDSAGISLKPLLASGEVLFQAVTNNFIPQGGAQAREVPCGFATFAPSAACVSLKVASGGDGYLVRQVPEPGTLALAGLALMGLGAVRRRRTPAE